MGSSGPLDKIADRASRGRLQKTGAPITKAARDPVLVGFRCMRKLSSLALLAFGISIGAVAQTPALRHPTSDAAKMADALRAAPPFITRGATILAWPTTPTGAYHVLRAGTTER